MNNLLNNQRSKFISVLLITSVFTSTAFAEETLLSFAEIKSQIIQDERAIILKKRDTLAKNVIDKKFLCSSTIMNEIREATRAKRKIIF